jgi:hypothetical protein
VNAQGQADPRSQEVAAAAALAGHYFPYSRADQATLHVQLKDLVFLLSGHLELWAQWPQLRLDEQRLITELLRLRDPELANANVVRSVLSASQLQPWPGIQFRNDGSEETIELRLGREPLEVAREWITTLRMDRNLTTPKKRPIAQDGHFTAPLFRGLGDLADLAHPTYSLGSLDVPDLAPIDLGEPAEADHLRIDLDELSEIAKTLDAAYGTTHRTASLSKVFDNLRTRGSEGVDTDWMLTAGPMQVLQAPTGYGKSVLTELVACWAVRHHHVMTIVVATNAAVIKLAHTLDRHLGVLGHHSSDGAVALTSPSSAHQAAEVATAGDPSEDGHGAWALRKMAYGCTLSVAASAEAIDAWEPGREPCTSLRRLDDRGRTSGQHACPWFAGCGKFRNVRAAAMSAPVVVTTFANWLSGIVPVSVRANGAEHRGMTVEELLLHRSHLVLIDEVDEFQSTMIKGQGGKIVLADHRPGDTAIRRVWSELRTARGALAGSTHRLAHSTTGLIMHLAENYVDHLAGGDFDRLRVGHGRGNPLLRRWMLPQKWDGFLTATLAGLNEDEPILPDHYDVFHAIFDPSIKANLPSWILPIQDAVAALQVNSGDDAFEEARALIAAALMASPHSKLADDSFRAMTTDRLLRRAYFGKLREMLTRFIYVGPVLSAAGVISAREIADKLRRYKQWRVAPLGPLGRTLFAFSENHVEGQPDSSALSVNAFGGDPHTYVPNIGETTALAHVGLRRCVLGLSATSYFPGAPHHHVFAEPTWWVSDSVTGGLSLHASPVTSDDPDFIRISGTSGIERRESMVMLGRHLWTKQLAPELRILASRPDTAFRQRLLLATTSYEGAADLARGLSAAGASSNDIVLAVPPNHSARPAASGAWQTMPADQLERYGRDMEGKILVAPLARAARGINMVDDAGRSLIGSVWLVVRPVPIIDEPAEILAHVHAATKAATSPSMDPGATLELMKQVAAKQTEELFNTLPYFSHLPRETRISIVAENLISIIQLAGRARRGDAHARIHLVDAAFHDAPGNSDLRRLIRDLRQQWTQQHDQPLALLESLYGDTLTEIFRFADETNQEHDEDEPDAY